QRGLPRPVWEVAHWGRLIAIGYPRRYLRRNKSNQTYPPWRTPLAKFRAPRRTPGPAQRGRRRRQRTCHSVPAGRGPTTLVRAGTGRPGHQRQPGGRVMSEEVRALLRQLGEQMPPARLSKDPWSAGRRQRRTARLRAALTVLTAAAVAIVGPSIWLGADGPAHQPATASDAVPRKVDTPWMWQATVQQAPPGRAALLLGGDGLGLRGIDLLDHEGKVAVVGRDGSYRMLLYHGAEVVPGEDVLLSPDGRYVVQSFVAGGPKGFLVVTDLTDGTSRALPGPQGRDC